MSVSQSVIVRKLFGGVARCAAVAALGIAAGVMLAPSPSSAQNALYQAFFTTMCGAGATGALATTCTAGTGPAISGDSEVSLNPSQTVSGMDAALARARERTRQALDRLEARRDAAAGQQDTGAEGASATFGRFSLLVNGRFAWLDSKRDRLDPERGYDGNVYTAQIGGDYRVSDRTVIGALLGYDRTDTEFHQFQALGVFTSPANDGDTETDSYSINLFGSHNFDDSLYVDANLGFSFTDYDFTRNSTFQDSARAVLTQGRSEGDTDGLQYAAGIGIGYDMYQDGMTLGPYVRFNVVHTTIDAYSERDLDGSGLAMRVDPDSRTSLTSVLGLRGSYAVSTSFGIVVPQARLEWEHEFDYDAPTANTSFVLDSAGTVFAVTGAKPDRDYMNIGAGIALVLPNGWLPFIDYEGLFGRKALNRHRVTFGLRKEL